MKNIKGKNHITSVPFLLCLSLLLLNDLYLKEVFNNWYTGKLSDFVGLFVFPLFWINFFPKRSFTVCWCTALLFMWWKSPLSQEFILWFSEYLFSITRVVDYSDLFALSMIPLAYWFSKLSISPIRISKTAIIIVASFAFFATARPMYYQKFTTPQYILLKNNMPFFSDEMQKGNSASIRDESFFYIIDTCIIFSISRVERERSAFVDDGYEEKKVLKRLDTLFYKNNIKYQDSHRKSGRNLDSLSVKGIHTFEIVSTHYRDSLIFKDRRLHGPFSRYNPQNERIISGYYHNGLPDSLWEYFSRDGKIVKQEFYKKGDLVRRTVLYEGVFKDTNIETRAEFIITKILNSLIGVTVIIFFLYPLYRKNFIIENQSDLKKQSKKAFGMTVTFLVGIGIIVMTITSLKNITDYSWYFLLLFVPIIGGMVFVWKVPLRSKIIKRGELLFPYVVSTAGLIIIFGSQMSIMVYSIFVIVLVCLILSKKIILQSFNKVGGWAVFLNMLFSITLSVIVIGLLAILEYNFPRFIIFNDQSFGNLASIVLYNFVLPIVNMFHYFVYGKYSLKSFGIYLLLSFMILFTLEELIHIVWLVYDL